MISHKHKCIFIHVPRTAGTSIEKSIYGIDWLHGDLHCSHGLATKHLCASTAKEIYFDYWEDYFKFSFVRNPWSRMKSLSGFPDYSGVTLNKGLLDVSGYKTKFPKIELDSRSASASPKRPPNKDSFIKNAVYLNILDEPLDFIGKFESLEKDMEYISSQLATPIDLPLSKMGYRAPSPYQPFYDNKNKKLVENYYLQDLKKFGYSFD